MNSTTPKFDEYRQNISKGGTWLEVALRDMLIEIHCRIDGIQMAMSPAPFEEAANWKGMYNDLQKVNDSMQASLDSAAQTMLRQEEEIATLRELLAKLVEGHAVEEWNNLSAQLQAAKKQAETLREENLQMKNKLATIYGNYRRPI